MFENCRLLIHQIIYLYLHNKLTGLLFPKEIMFNFEKNQHWLPQSHFAKFRKSPKCPSWAERVVRLAVIGPISSASCGFAGGTIIWCYSISRHQEPYVQWRRHVRVPSQCTPEREEQVQPAGRTSWRMDKVLLSTAISNIKLTI